jgi:hypothetical protein
VASGGITAQKQRLLKRDGENEFLELKYTFNMGVDQSLMAAVRYSDHDGKAMAWDGYSAEINYMKVFDDHRRLITNVNYGQFDAKADNPVYDKRGGFNRLGVGVTAFYARPFGLDDWSANMGVVYFKEDNDINFLNQGILMIALGMLYRF